MKTATVRDLRNDFARLSKWLEQGETIEIVKRGKAVADLVPKNVGQRKSLLGCTPSPCALPADIDDPLEAELTLLTSDTQLKGYRHARIHYFTPVLRKQTR